MNPIVKVDPGRLIAAYEKARLDLLGQREPSGHWVGELANSALSTATAVSALTLAERHDPTDASGRFADEGRETELSGHILRGIHWLADQQNPDGGWGDTDKSYSNIATTMLVVAAFKLTCVPADHEDLMARAEQYIQDHGGIAALKKRYGADKTFAAPILTNCALAGMVPWKQVPALPFELASVPQRFYRFVGMPVVSYAIPALVAIGQVKHYFRKPWNPIPRAVRRAAWGRSLRVIERMQPDSGGYLEAVPLTSFVVMSLAASGRADHVVARRGVQFLLDSVRPDGSWPIDTNLATWNTTLAMNALSSAGDGDSQRASALDWLLSCQHHERHAFTGADPGGWGWSDLSGAVPDADDTSGALLALASLAESDDIDHCDMPRLERAAAEGVRWLLGLQNRDGGWPTFCRGWGKLPFDRSGCDLTAHAIRAILAWRREGWSPAAAAEAPSDNEMAAAIARGFDYLRQEQRGDGSWVPLWFGNQNVPKEENPVYGTARVLLAFRDAAKTTTDAARRGFDWLARAQNADGGWGGGPAELFPSPEEARGRQPRIESSVEETAIALEALLAAPEEARFAPVVEKGLDWMLSAVEKNRHWDSSPIGFYFAKLWYYERHYPLTFTVSVLGQAISRLLPRLEQKSAAASLPSL